MRSVSEDVEGIWREAWQTAPEGAQTFREALSSKYFASRRFNQTGSLASVSKNGTSQSYSIGSGSSKTTLDNERDCLAALKMYERLASTLSLSDDEEAIYNAGLLELSSPPTEYYPDLTLLRFP